MSLGSPDPPLSRGAQILEWILAGETDGQIAEALSLSAHTVEHHRRDMLHAAGVATTPKFLAMIWGEKVTNLTAEIERLTRELRLLSRRVDEADNRRRGPDRRGSLGPV